MKKIILTGDRPTGHLHVGHYVGSLRERVALQNSGKFDDIFIEIADAQALTDNADNPEKVRKNILQVALDYLSVGIDPNKSHIFIQSLIPALPELMMYYLNLVTVARLERNPTVKAEIQQKHFETSIPAGFLCYPVSQAADITAFMATTVPTGEDQEPMLEQTREIVRKFNEIYGETLVEPEIVLSMYTDPTHLRKDDPGHVEGNPVFTYLDAFCKPEYFPEFLPEYADLDELKAHYTIGGLGDVKVKRFLNRVMQAELAPIREKRHYWEERLPEVVNILEEGTRFAAAVADDTLQKVRKAMRIDYFEKGNLLK